MSLTELKYGMHFCGTAELLNPLYKNAGVLLYTRLFFFFWQKQREKLHVRTLKSLYKK